MKILQFSRPGTALAAALMLAATAGRPARAVELIVNGGFESGLTGWTRADFLSSDGTFFAQSGTTSPVSGFTVPAPPGGTTAAMTDAQAGGSHVLYQDFVVPTGMGNGTLQFNLFVGNQAKTPSTGQQFFATPAAAGLDWTTATNQQARVDILRGGTDPFSVAAGDILQTVFQTNPNNSFSLTSYMTVSANVDPLLTTHPGQTLRLRFAEVDNAGPFQLGIDNVSLNAVPEPAGLVLLGLGLATLGLVARRRRPNRA